jgi:2-polyprenyl-6-methoxyphenol hydroxylase-like FAD-dependent oxidoreductase
MSDTHDVAIVGAGPTGLTLATLLGQAGVDVVLLERLPEPMGLPRAIRFDHELSRVWQQLDIMDELLEDALPVDRYDWFGADGELIVQFRMPYGPSGWPFSFVFFQPELERALEEAASAQPTVMVRRGVTFEGVMEAGDHVEIDVGEGDPVRARYLVGADGGRSSVRRSLGIDLEDLGAGERWLVIDVEPTAAVKERLADYPQQLCDPARPTMLGPNGRRHRRWEFMLLPGEQPEDFDDQSRIWAMLEPWMAPGEGRILRQAVYEFRAAVARTSRRGRCLLIGDAAHMMPPQMGEGMCSGVRDATALAWRLRLILDGTTPEELLDSYSTERLPHARVLVEQSLALGRVSCELDPIAAAQRDARLRADGVGESWPFPLLGPGLSPDAPLAGTLSPQGVVAKGGHEGRFDDIVGRGFVVIALDADPATALGDDARRGLAALDALIVGVGEAQALRDVDGRLTAWLRESGVAAVVVRPDFAVFGAVTSLDDLNGLVIDLLNRVGVRVGAQR